MTRDGRWGAFSGAAATVSGGVFVLWLLLAGAAPAEIVVGLVVAIAAGIWAQFADL